MREKLHVRSTTSIGLACVIAVTLMFGASSTLLRLPFASEIDPLVLAAGAMLMGGIPLAAYCMVRGLLPLVTLRKNWWNLLNTALAGTALPIMLIIIAQPHASAVTGGFISQLQYPAGVLFAGWLLREKVSTRNLAGILLAFVGGVLMITQGNLATMHGDVWSFLLLLSAFLFGFSFVPAKRLAVKMDALAIAAVRLCLAGIFVVVVIGVVVVLHHRLVPLMHPLDGVDIATLVIYIITNYMLAFIVIQMALRSLPAKTYALWSQATPIVSTIFALLVLHEALNIWQIVGAVVILCGLVLPQVGSKPEQ
jgi:drug/metabolite transporter (DMT)-like permease